jgi:hypothetical protein
MAFGLFHIEGIQPFVWLDFQLAQAVTFHELDCHADMNLEFAERDQSSNPGPI